ncbi:hypothetical protein RvY_17616 [Ramazzottius varieornatus]|uniref:Uncharacterized protein n=1 Tax=Ramazzottius varieornatus TaxID=947166 RepID=A0A1D1W3H7_RAMVA|nr:hypothetical protein RvY_17616 [Ramazzottius varieornatus]
MWHSKIIWDLLRQKISAAAALHLESSTTQLTDRHQEEHHRLVQKQSPTIRHSEMEKQYDYQRCSVDEEDHRAVLPTRLQNLESRFRKCEHSKRRKSSNFN